MYLLDTNVVSELRKRERANPGVVDFHRCISAQEAYACLSVITVGELRRGKWTSLDSVRCRPRDGCVSISVTERQALNLLLLCAPGKHADGVRALEKLVGLQMVP